MIFVRRNGRRNKVYSNESKVSLLEIQLSIS